MLKTGVISRVSLIPAQSRFYWKNRFLFYFYVKHKFFKIKKASCFQCSDTKHFKTGGLISFNQLSKDLSV